MNSGMCGRWRNGRLVDHCLMAGSEECDFECPHNGEASDASGGTTTPASTTDREAVTASSGQDHPSKVSGVSGVGEAATVQGLPQLPSSEYRYSFRDLRMVGSMSDGTDLFTADQMREYALASRLAAQADARKLWLWKNFVDGRPEYWAFDNPYPINLDNGDPQTLGEPCGYALFKPSRQGRFDKTEEQVLSAIRRAATPQAGGEVRALTDEEIDAVTIEQYGPLGFLQDFRAYARAIEKAVQLSQPAKGE